MNFIKETMETIRKKEKPTQREVKKEYFEKVKRMQEKFMTSMIDLVEKSVIDKKKKVVIPVSRREDIPKMRHLIRRISKSFGFKVKSNKKRRVTVENTDFIVNKIQSPNYAISDPIKVKGDSTQKIENISSQV